MSFTQTFTSSGTWTPPLGVITVQAECWGGGGASTGGFVDNGGGGGAYAKTNSISVISRKTYTVTVGQGSTGGGASVSSFTGESGQTCVADCGRDSDDTGAGGTTANSTGDTKIAGGNGGVGLANSLGGGGGGCAGSNGATGGGGGAGGAGGYGGGAGGDGGDFDSPLSPVCDGEDGVAPGGGGGGAGGDGLTNGSGGDGAAGQVKLTWDITEFNISMCACVSP